LAGCKWCCRRESNPHARGTRRSQRRLYASSSTAANFTNPESFVSRVLFLVWSPSPGDDHSSKQQPETGRAARNASVCLAPSEVYLATDCYQRPGGLLPHPFTLTCVSRRGPSAVFSLLHYLSGRPALDFPGTLLCGARTFLDLPVGRPRSSCLLSFRENLLFGFFVFRATFADEAAAGCTYLFLVS